MTTPCPPSLGADARRQPKRSPVRLLLGAAFAGAAFVGSAWAGGAPDLSAIGRAATRAEVRAWDIDVRGDFRGLPKGSGSVELGSKVWDTKCAACHGDFGESNQVFTPIVGGTSKQDIESGRTFFLSHSGYPHRTTLMKVSKLSSLWDYINRAMPWNAPKSLQTDEVYAVLAYILHLGDIVPAGFTLSDRNIADTEKRLPNRFGHVFFNDMWVTRGAGDVKNPRCMKNCPVEARIASALPDGARNSNGNIAEQVRPFGPARGTDTSVPPGRHYAGVPPAMLASAAPIAGVAPGGPALVAASGGEALSLIKANACTGCHGVTQKIVGPAFQDVAKKYAGRSDAVDYLAAKIRNGGQGVWGPIPMPAQAQLKETDARAIAQWMAAGAKE